MSDQSYIGVYRPDPNTLPHLRSQLERAGDIALAFEPAYPAIWPDLEWPEGLCIDTILILVPILRLTLAWEVKLVAGRVSNWVQTWIVTPEGDIIDPTYGQFDGGPALRILPANNSHALGHVPIITLTPEHEHLLLKSFRSGARCRAQKASAAPDKPTNVS